MSALATPAQPSLELPAYLDRALIQSAVLPLGYKGLRRMMDSGTFPQPVRIGNRFFWKREEVLDALQALGQRDAEAEDAA
jgi:hypothetical protein